jgi:hypothetical protein
VICYGLSHSGVEGGVKLLSMADEIEVYDPVMSPKLFSSLSLFKFLKCQIISALQVFRILQREVCNVLF